MLSINVELSDLSSKNFKQFKENLKKLRNVSKIKNDEAINIILEGLQYEQ